MALANRTTESICAEVENSPLVLAKGQSRLDLKNVRALIADFFSWLEDEWQQPLNHDSPGRDELLSQLPFPFPLDEERTYTIDELIPLSARAENRVRKVIKELGIRPAGRLPRWGRAGSNYLYLGRDFGPAFEMWKWKDLGVSLDALWARFLPEPCGTCSGCKQKVRVTVFHCSKTRRHEIRQYRESFYRFLQTLRHYEDFASWWRHEQHDIYARCPGSITQHSGIVLFYLLDRHALDLSIDELLRLPFPDIQYADFLRPWSHRCPEEYKSYLHTLETVTKEKGGRTTIQGLLAIMVFMRYGFSELSELGRRLSSEEVALAVREGRLLTARIAYGVTLGLPLSDDIRVGHVVLDDMRNYFWSYARDRIQAEQRATRGEEPRRRMRWEDGPRTWRTAHIRALERMLTANAWHNGQALLPRRPETESILQNLYLLCQRAEREGHALYQLPAAFQEVLMTYIEYRYQEQRVTLKSLKNDLEVVMPFISWAQRHRDLSSYAHWNRTTVREVVQGYLSTRYSQVKESRLYHVLSMLYTFFHTLAKLELPHPPGYQAILTLLPSDYENTRYVPPEEVLDRVFYDGVCHLDYDPFARLALTIQYFCGTRVTETCELPLFCLVEDNDAQILYLVIPRGKSKQERSFPIASVGMGPLLEYMEQVVHMQLLDGVPLHDSRMNVRYLETDPEKAFHWDYLFDRSLHYPEHRGTRLSVLNYQRVDAALQEALLFAAKKNPRGLFHEETYTRHCSRQRNARQVCGYVSLADGITVCPVCTGPLPGRRGHRCSRRLTRDFECDGVGQQGDYFCPRCDAPLAELVPIKTHTFRHNSVTRAHRHGLSLAQNMLLHGHKTIPMHLKYLHLLPQDQLAEVSRVFTEKFLQDIRLEHSYAPGQVIEEGIAHTPSYEQLLGLTFRRGLTRGTFGLWGGFWTGALAEEGIVSPLKGKVEIILTEETYLHALAQYRFEALGLAVSEVALERGTKGKFKATVASFLERREIERVVSSYLEQVQRGYLNTARGVRLLEGDIQAQRRFLNELAALLHPWVQRLGLESIDDLVAALLPATDVFRKQGDYNAFDQKFPPAESAS